MAAGMLLARTGTLIVRARMLPAASPDARVGEPARFSAAVR